MSVLQVALRRQQAQEEAEARQLGVEILKPGDRAELVGTFHARSAALYNIH